MAISLGLAARGFSLSGVRPMPRRRAVPRGSAARPAIDEASEELASRLLPLVRRIAVKLHRRLPPQVELDELVGAGSLGLVDAIHKFDPRKAVKLETYASHRIRGAMLDSLRGLDPASRDLRTKSKEVAAVQRKLEARLGRAVEDSDMASEMDLDLAQWHRLAHELQPLVELRIPTTRNSDADDPFDRCYRVEQREILNRALVGLPKREKAVLSLYYRRGVTMRGIAGRLGVDESRVSQIHSVARARLAKRVNALLRNGHGGRGNPLRSVPYGTWPRPVPYGIGILREQVPNQSNNSAKIW